MKPFPRVVYEDALAVLSGLEDEQLGGKLKSLLHQGFQRADLDRMSDPPDLTMLRELLAAIGSEPPDVQTTLVSSLLLKDSEPLRAALAYSLGRHLDLWEVAEPLILEIASPSQPHFLKYSLRTAEKAHSGRFCKQAVDALGSKDVNLVLEALEYCRRLRCLSCCDRVSRLLQSRDEMVVGAAVAVVAELRCGIAEKHLLRLCGHGSREIHLAAVSALAAVGTRASIPALSRLPERRPWIQGYVDDAVAAIEARESGS